MAAPGHDSLEGESDAENGTKFAFDAAGCRRRPRRSGRIGDVSQRIWLLMIKDEMFAAVTAQRLRLLDTVSDLTPAQWNTPSLCAGWRNRDVLGHLVSILDVPTRRFLTGSVRRGGFNAFAGELARHYGEREPSELMARYRELASEQFAPPIVGPIAPLTDVYIHTRDIERSLGIESTLDRLALATVVAYAAGGKARGFVPGKRVSGLRFEAPDVNWTHGSGAVVSGSGEAIIMAVTGRRVALDDLTGDGVGVLRMRLGD